MKNENKISWAENKDGSYRGQYGRLELKVSKTNLIPGTPWSCDIKKSGKMKLRYAFMGKTAQSTMKRIEDSI